jgi:ABC-type phosphate transport system substrate-binding protein
MRKRLTKLSTEFMRVVTLAAVMLILVPGLASAEGTIEENGGIAIVVHKDTDVGNLSMNELRNIFLANQQFWSDRSRIILLVRAPQSDERDYVLNRIYQMDEAQFRQYWIAKMFRAEVPRGPKIVFSTDMTLDLVVAIPGSISFMRADQVSDAVKIVSVDGKLPSDEGYPLK